MVKMIKITHFFGDFSNVYIPGLDPDPKPKVPDPQHIFWWSLS
jgi:hypothetical protein